VKVIDCDFFDQAGKRLPREECQNFATTREDRLSVWERKNLLKVG